MTNIQPRMVRSCTDVKVKDNNCVIIDLLEQGCRSHLNYNNCVSIATV